MIRKLLLVVIVAAHFNSCSQAPANPIRVNEGGDSIVELNETVQLEMVDSTRYTYKWLNNYSVENTIVNRIEVPAGYYRLALDSGSFGDWLRHLPLKQGKPDVLLYDKSKKWNQRVHVAVIDMDVDERDLQQCADAVMRLKAEYHFQKGSFDSIHFNYMCGDAVGFEKWSSGNKPVPINRSVIWKSCSSCDDSYESFRKYLIQIYNYAGTISLERELKPKSWKDIEVGDVVIQGGSPGHAIAVVDIAVNPETGDKVFLLAQSYMPAQESHIIRNPNNDKLSPWYSISDIGPGDFITPEWWFPENPLRGW